MGLYRKENSMSLIFDTHAHYLSRQFDADRDQLLRALPNREVGLIMECATDYDTSCRALQLAEEYSWVYAAVGIHPESLIEEDASTKTRFLGDWKAELRAIAPLYDNPKVRAVGECGLDFHWPIPREEQLSLFEAQIKVALERDLPIIVHDRQAHAETYALLKKYRPRGVVHCYSGSAQDVKWLTDQGLYIGFGGVVTFANARRTLEAAVAVPLNYLVLETDCPYMAPVPYRGKRCDSSMIAQVAQTLAGLRGVSCQEILAQTWENGHRLYGIG